MDKIRTSKLNFLHSCTLELEPAGAETVGRMDGWTGQREMRLTVGINWLQNNTKITRRAHTRGRTGPQPGPSNRVKKYQRTKYVQL